jgi:hypothetical protein
VSGTLPGWKNSVATPERFISTYWGYEKTWTRELLRSFARELGRHAKSTHLWFRY